MKPPTAFSKESSVHMNRTRYSKVNVSFRPGHQVPLTKLNFMLVFNLPKEVPVYRFKIPTNTNREL